MRNKSMVGRPIQKGQVLNPLGGRAHNPELKLLRRMSNAEIAQIGTLVLDGNVDGLKALVQDKNSSVLRVWMSTVALKAIQKGDAHALSIILDRIAGKPKEFIELSGGTNSKVDVTSLSDADLRARIAKLEADV